MDIVGERWALLVVRELVFGPKRFGDLRAGLPRASQNVLSQRLRELEQSGIVRRVQLGPPASVHAYELTERGQQLEPTLIELSRWGRPARGAGRRDEHRRVHAAAQGPLSASGRHAGDRSTPVAGGHRRLRGGRVSEGISVARGRSGQVDVTVTGTVNALLDLMFGGTPLRSAVTAGEIEVHGDSAAAERFFPLFGAGE
ncbi:winged helix-turn-helix transcriptional regulator [Micromonospora sp. M12]